MTKPLTRRELVLEIAELAELDVQDARRMLVALGEIVEREIAAGVAIRVPGVALVKPVYLKARPRRRYINPRTGDEQILSAIAGRTKLRARPAANLRSVLPGPRSKVGLQLSQNGR